MGGIEAAEEMTPEQLQAAIAVVSTSTALNFNLQVKAHHQKEVDTFLPVYGATKRLGKNF